MAPRATARTRHLRPVPADGPATAAQAFGELVVRLPVPAGTTAQQAWALAAQWFACSPHALPPGLQVSWRPEPPAAG